MRLMKAGGHSPDIFIYNALISVYMRAGDIAGAKAVKDEIVGAGLEPTEATERMLGPSTISRHMEDLRNDARNAEL